MGEIGIEREPFLYGLKWWELNAIVKGYRRRERTSWTQTRWLAFNLMCRIPADKSMAEVGVHSEEQLLPLPWDKEKKVHDQLPSDSDVEELQALIHDINSKKDES